MSRNYSVLKHEYLKEMELLSDEEFGKLCRGLLAYSISGEEPSLTGDARFYWNRVREQEDRCRDRFEESSKRRAEAGRKSGEARRKKSETTVNNDEQCSTIVSNGKQSLAIVSNAPYNNNNNNNDSNNNSKDTPLPPFQGGLLDAVNEWLAYKKEKRQAYKPLGLKRLYSDIQKQVDGIGEDAVISSIHDSMSRNYSGIYYNTTVRQKPQTESIDWMSLAKED